MIAFLDRLRRGARVTCLVWGNNSNDPVVGCVSGVVVDEGVFINHYMKCGLKSQVVAHEGEP